ncbi:MAG: hypothetical protein COV72_02410 [Candidatus Omnitrophica bacterium CG11_big_fil_rev_8_21_14_0_20_42_13]|uniref:Secretin/TonB short N-terminal domain-containing protein n=1 Tax=Candidatus Ghiorseimicrobium undicola TaxID=1974746 RepID=A0A2H0LYN5_9BACT|nr:MAG: hypothetical protein COV72_02410 [Candidatus Omnitrophica bacterium CG11_big_fil_rev_8_21_14_0_20_42_13]
MRIIKNAVCFFLAVCFLLGFPLGVFAEVAEDYFQSAAQYYLRGDLEQARIQLDTARKIDPNYEPANKLNSLIKEKIGLGEKGDTLLSLDFHDADITVVLQALSKAYGLNIIAGEKVNGKVTVSFREVNLEQALDAVLKVNGYTYERKNNIITVLPEKGDKETLVIPLKYSSADAVKEMFAKTISVDGAIEVHREANSLVVTDLSGNIKKIKTLMKDVDVPPVQISIEAKLVDIQSKDLRALGVKYTADYTDTDIFGHRGSSNTTEEEIKGTFDLGEESSSLSGGQFSLETFNIKHWVADATIDALISKQKAHLLASPSITTLNNSEAKIIIGEKVPYREETQTPVGTTETTNFIDVGISLSVTPRVSDDEYVTMTIHPEVSSVSELLDAGPRITTREADTVVRVRDGETVVIGGLIKNQNDGVRSRIPILGNIPILGLLFSNKSEDRLQTELAVFITPHIVRPGVKTKLENTFSPVSAESLYTRAMNLIDRLGVETWDRTKEETLREAASIFEQLIKDYSSSEKADDALYNLGMIYYREKSLKNLDKSKAAFEQLLKWYPESRYVSRAQTILKKIASIQKREKARKK